MFNSKFKQIDVSKFRKGACSFSIVKVQKVGTSRVFFTPVYKEKRLTSTLFAKKCNAMSYMEAVIKSRALDVLSND
jgi:hypothetical protein